MSNSENITFTIADKEHDFKVRTPSLFNRSQFFMLISTVFGLDRDSTKINDIDLNDIFTLNEANFRRFLAVSIEDPDNLLRLIDFEEIPKNYGQAQLAIRVFFIELIQIVNAQVKSTESSASSKKNTGLSTEPSTT